MGCSTDAPGAHGGVNWYLAQQDCPSCGSCQVWTNGNEFNCRVCQEWEVPNGDSHVC
jgi:hypothetical protein